MNVDGLFIIGEEEGSHMATHPYWPGGASGVTLPVGYDLGQQLVSVFRDDWIGLDAPALHRLEPCVGVRGADAGLLARSSAIQNIVIPKAIALTVFTVRTLPRYSALALKTYPGLDRMPDQVQTALTSLCFNRGGLPLLSATGESPEGESTDSDRYDEERLIRQAVGEGNIPNIASALRAMKRLWPDVPGLQARREREAALCEATYPA